MACKKAVKFSILTLFSILLLLLSFQFLVQIGTSESDFAPMHIAEALSHPVDFIATDLHSALRLLFEGSNGQSKSIRRDAPVRVSYPDPIGTVFFVQAIAYNQDKRPVMGPENGCSAIRIVSIPLGGHAPPENRFV